ncbi:hypothetical protein [Nocardioides marmoriginsengisoli]|nr:hypothetical protein [Nocardioides marmoriginsengisoli]
MDSKYRRRPPASRLEHLLARLLRRYVAPKAVVPRVDVAHTEVIEFRQA